MSSYHRIEDNILFTWLEMEMNVEFEIDEEDINICSVTIGSGENEMDITKAITGKQEEDFKDEVKEVLTEKGEADQAAREDYEYELARERRLYQDW